LRSTQEALDLTIYGKGRGTVEDPRETLYIKYDRVSEENKVYCGKSYKINGKTVFTSEQDFESAFAIPVLSTMLRLAQDVSSGYGTVNIKTKHNPIFGAVFFQNIHGNYVLPETGLQWLQNMRMILKWKDLLLLLKLFLEDLL